MNPMNRKALILSIPVILAALLLGGWLLLREPQSAPESQNPPVVKENPPQNAGNLQPPANVDTSIDTSNWKTYRNEEYGIEFEYPATLLYVIDDVDSADVLDIRIIQNGRTGKDIDKPGMMGIVLNNFASQKYGFAVKQGLCESIDVLGKRGEVCDEDISGRGKAKAAYFSFIQDGSCSENFGVILFEPEYSNKDAFGMNNIYVSCDRNNEEVMSIFQNIYKTIRFTK